ncbi:MAG: glycogen/starch synthase [Patescibacteria group bacterium]
MLKVLICASEVAPIIKLGGLGDVVGSLPKSLEKIGVDADVVVPFVPSAKIEGLKVYKSMDIQVPYDGESRSVGVYATKLPGSFVDVYLLKYDKFFGEAGKSAFLNNMAETKIFSFFSRCVVELIKTRFNTYDVVHCNDWHTGLITHILEDELSLERPATIMTIHNLSYQGVGDTQILKEVGLDSSCHKTIEWDISDGDVNFLMQGIASADFVNTVSPSYAKELLVQEDSSKISQVLTSRQDRFIGILNGLDYSAYPREFNADNYQSIKSLAKKNLSQELGIDLENTPVFSVVTRLDPNQKGLDILLEVLPEVVERGGKFILLGSGNKEWEAKFKESANKLGLDNVSINTTFDTELAVRIYEASDFFLIPSKFEPCGLTQMISMWYGAIPVVHAVGGLRDTVKEGKTGFLFDKYSAVAFKKSLNKCFNTYKSPLHSDMIKECLKADFSFDKSAKSYKELYDKAVQIRQDAFVEI